MVIRECWNDATNDEARELLLEMIWWGAVGKCVDLARSVVFDERSTPYHREYGCASRLDAECRRFRPGNVRISGPEAARAAWETAPADPAPDSIAGWDMVLGPLMR